MNKPNNIRISDVFDTLTPGRLTKYVLAAKSDRWTALRLYDLNKKVSAALMVDLHYVEVAMRNKFDAQLAAAYGPAWFTDVSFLRTVSGRTRAILLKAQVDASRSLPVGAVPLPGKVVAELTFGFWLGLTDARLEHTLWTPTLHKAFLPRPVPSRASFNARMETLRQLRNRIAHHEPIFRQNLNELAKNILEATSMLCPETARFMKSRSTSKRAAMALSSFQRRKGL